MRIGCLRTHLVVLIVIAAVVILGGCSESDSETGADPAVVAARRSAGIADCPAPGSGTATPDLPDGEGLPDVSLPCLGGDVQVSLASLAGSRPLVINVWATWCGPCRTEAPFLAAVSAELADQVQFIGIDHVDPDPMDAVGFAEAARWTYPQLADPDGEGAQALKVAGLPQTLFVASDGTVVYRHRGAFTSDAELRDLIATHLGVG